jgi:hypothetical protein
MFVETAISAYVGLVLYSIIALVVPAKALSGLSEQIPQGLALVLTIVGLGKANLTTGITHAAVGNLSALSYLRYGDQRGQIVGNHARLIQHLHERKAVCYDRIDLIAYCFGTIIALDSLFPPMNCGVATFADIDELVAIGCPFEFVRIYWSTYFDDREWIGNSSRAKPLDWLNIYLPIDVLSSNFRDDNQPGDPTVGIPTNNLQQHKPTNLVYDDPASADELGFINLIALLGLRSHDFYWGSETSPDLGVFPQIVSRLYAGDPVLA